MTHPNPSAGPAAGPLHLIQSFANTLSADPDVNLLSTCEEAASWLGTAGLLPAEARLSNSEHGALLRLRESVRNVLAAHAEGREDAEAAARLTRALADGRLVLTVNAASTVHLASAARASYSHVVAAIAVAIAGSAASGSWARLKICLAPGCGKAFYDDTAQAGATHCSRHPDGR